jgi:hypothetical protein
VATIEELIQQAQDALAVALAQDASTFWYKVGNKMVNKEHYVEMLLKTIDQLGKNVEPDFALSEFDDCTGQAGQDCTEYIR